MLLVIVFLGLFAAVALSLIAVSASRTELRQTLSRLESIGREARDTAELSAVPVKRQERLSAISWLNRLLQNADVGRRLQLLLSQADLPWTVGRLLLTTSLAAALTGFFVQARIRNPWPALVFAALAGSAPFLYVSRRRSKRLARIQQLLPESLDLMAAALRAGHSFTAALGLVARQSAEPLRRELRQCFDEQNFGLELRTALSNLALRVPVHEIRVVVTAVLIQKETGGNLTEILEKTATLIREDLRLQRQIMVYTAQGRLTGWILAGLPLLLGSILYLIRPEHMSLLWKTPLGLKMLYAAVAMTLLGVGIIHKIVNSRI